MYKYSLSEESSDSHLERYVSDLFLTEKPRRNDLFLVFFGDKEEFFVRFLIVFVKT